MNKIPLEEKNIKDSFQPIKDSAELKGDLEIKEDWISKFYNINEKKIKKYSLLWSFLFWRTIKRGNEWVV